MNKLTEQLQKKICQITEEELNEIEQFFQEIGQVNLQNAFILWANLIEIEQSHSSWLWYAGTAATTGVAGVAERMVVVQALRAIPIPQIIIGVNVALTVAFLFQLYTFDKEKARDAIIEKYIEEALNQKIESQLKSTFTINNQIDQILKSFDKTIFQINEKMNQFVNTMNQLREKQKHAHQLEVKENYFEEQTYQEIYDKLLKDQIFFIKNKQN